MIFNKLLLLIFLINLNYLGLLAQLKNHLLPVNPELIEYYNNIHKTQKKAAIINNQPTGYIPPYVQLPEYYISRNLMENQSLAVGLPSKFDLRDYNLVSSVKNQGSGNYGGNCWAFSSIGSIESCWMNILTSLNANDLSEHNMATCHGYSWKFGEGGNEFFPVAYLSKLKGPVKETQVPYNTQDTATHHCTSSYTPVAYFPESRWIYNNPILTKKMIMDYGAVSTNIHWDNVYYNSSIASFYSDDKTGPNHAILLVGWDDDFETQHGKGAWIAKNSWGTEWGKNGFFYISYADNQILKPASFYPAYWATSSIDTLFTTTSIGVVSFYGYSNDIAYSLVKYNAKSEKYIRKVGIFLPRTGSTVEISIYNEKNDTVGDLINKYNSDASISPGFFTYDVPALVNGNFYVLVKYYTPGLTRPIPLEIKADILGEPYSEPYILKSGSQWVSEDGKKWQPIGSDVKDWEANIVMHVYASSTNKPVANFITDKFEVCTGSQITFTNKSLGNINTYSWNFGTSALPSTATGAGPHTITIPASATEGLIYAQLTVSGPQGTDTYTKAYKIVKEHLTTVIGAPDYIKMKDTAILTAIADGQSYLWFPSDDLSDSTSKTVKFQSNVSGLHKFTVEVKQGSCSGSYTINVNVKQPPTNDEACNAILLNKGENGPFTNRGATVEFNEPHPADTSCYDEMSWCNEGGLQNSVWFKVIGPQNGKLSIDSRGMDTQIAIYNSDTCTNIKQGDLIAANDDYYAEAPYAAAIDEISVVPGKTYWIQVDGSAGGEEGEFYLTVSDGPLGQSTNLPVSINKKVQENNYAMISPNPSNGIIELTYFSDNNENIFVSVHDLSGKLVLKQNYFKNIGLFKTNLYFTHLSKGMYLIRIQTDNSIYVLKNIYQ